jgi:hypothetical protein
MINVPLLDLKAQFIQIRAEVMPIIESVCASQQFILGEHVRALEEEVARYSSASFGIGVSSGTDALLLALMAVNVGSGDEVITSPYTFFATAGTVARLGARPVFCDIDPATFNLSPAAVQTFCGHGSAFGIGAQAWIDTDRRRRAGDRHRVPWAARGVARRHRLLLVFSEQESRRVRRCGLVHLQ